MRLHPARSSHSAVLRTARADKRSPAGSVVVDLPQMNAVGPIDPQRRSFAEWFFPLQVSLEYVDAAPELPAALSPFRIVHVEDDSIGYFTMRHDMRFEMVKRLGAWERPHPYISAFIGADALAEILPAVLDALPLFLGDANRGAFMVADNAP